MVASRRYCDTLNGFHLVRQFDELHCLVLECLLDNNFAYSIHHFHLTVLLYDPDLVLGLKREVRAESVIEI